MLSINTLSADQELLEVINKLPDNEEKKDYLQKLKTTLEQPSSSRRKAQLLDEMIDNGGFPLNTEPNILREMIAPPNIVNKGASDVKYSKNEVFADLVEEMDAIINRDGTLAKCEIYGEVQVNCHIPGLGNPVKFFHLCLQMDNLSLSYRVRKLQNTPIYVKPQLTSDEGTCRFSVLVGIRNNPGKTIDSVTVEFQLPPCILSTDLTSNHGTVNIFANKICSWSIGRIPKDKSPSLSGTFVLEDGLKRLRVFPTLQVSFRIMGVALSGVKIDKLDLKTVPYSFYKGFRPLTRAGEFEVRS
ncbi:hypothetical protein L6164_008456 [Bauhinia variegata]|uniref:Uncharacterized protein n=1 Tax=Bauhinia variegata TaxID=167791 RepID=A0ACB9PFY1_BAUVA|nr:hypothetical protein L6164_008456 [Bauhinia variegata]